MRGCYIYGGKPEQQKKKSGGKPEKGKNAAENRKSEVSQKPEMTFLNHGKPKNVKISAKKRRTVLKTAKA